MEILIGLLIIAIGAFCQSSCYVPINKIKDWSWESYWIDEYHIDGFRFDLMGVHDIETMHRLASWRLLEEHLSLGTDVLGIELLSLLVAQHEG